INKGAMSLKKQLLEEMKQAMKSGQKVKLEVVRMLRSRIKNIEIDEGELDDAGVQKVVGKQIKQWKDALEDYKRGGREDLVEETEQKIKYLKEYLPEQISEEEIKQVIEKVKAESGIDQAGPLIGKVMQKVGSKAEGSKVAQLVRKMV
ncbi:MAG: GatB/YqeY domain-containing protein, partial [Patescibacteria group bacterium]|nr:GatB/YqeY domain-containing protein [Patescibacteria group bacterium]